MPTDEDNDEDDRLQKGKNSFNSIQVKSLDPSHDRMSEFNYDFNKVYDTCTLL